MNSLRYARVTVTLHQSFNSTEILTAFSTWKTLSFSSLFCGIYSQWMNKSRRKLDFCTFVFILMEDFEFHSSHWSCQRPNFTNSYSFSTEDLISMFFDIPPRLIAIFSSRKYISQTASLWHLIKTIHCSIMPHPRRLSNVNVLGHQIKPESKHSRIDFREGPVWPPCTAGLAQETVTISRWKLTKLVAAGKRFEKGWHKRVRVR